ncbi:MAG: hypothetical protein ABI629_12785 [bacterium]
MRRDLIDGLRFLGRLSPLLRTRLTADAALATVRQHLATRQQDFLALLRAAVFPHPAQPVHRLLARAGCSYGDVEQLVRREGLEGALLVLFGAGVDFGADEIAGRVPVVRGSDRFTVSLSDFRNPSARGPLTARSGGSRSGAPGMLALELDALSEQFPSYSVAYAAAGFDYRMTALWTAPGTTGIAFSIRNVVMFGHPVVRWFSPVDVHDAALPRTHRWMPRAVQAVAATQGVHLARPEFVSPADPRPILDWIAAARRAGQRPFLALYPTSAVRLCEAAAATSTDLDGVTLLLLGEPVTAARIEAVRHAGAVAWTLYGTIETGIVGQGCLRPQAVDEVHVYEDLHALLQPGADGSAAGLPAAALLVTALRPHSRLVTVNASVGDQAVLSRRDCGCPLQAVGWQTHLSEIHSFEKLTGMGMTFAAAEVTPLLEHLLPARFGGVATDYQLVEEEVAGGGVRLRLIVHPRLGALDDAAVVDAFLSGLAQVSPTRRVMTLAWRAGDIVHVDRSPPLAAPSGKIMHFRRTAGS